MCGHTDTGSHQACSRRCRSRAIATEIKIVCDPLRSNRVGRSESCHAGAGYDRSVREPGGECFDQHNLLVCQVEAFDQDLGVAEDFSDVCRVQTKVTGGGPHVRIDAGQGVTQSVDLGQPDLVNEVLLAIQVGGFNDIKVGNDQVTDAGAGQRNRNRRAEAADTGNSDRGAFDRFVDAGSVPRRQQGVKLVGTGYLTASNQDHLVAIVQQGYCGSRKTVDDDQIGISLDAISDRTGGFIRLCRVVLFVDRNLHSLKSSINTKLQKIRVQEKTAL